MEPANVLVVDDERHILDVLRDALTHFGYRVTSAASGAEALTAIRSELFDAAITDIRMPDMSGLDLLREIKKHDDSIEVVVMVILGGMGNNVGVIIAAILLTVLTETLRKFGDYRMALYSALLIVLMLTRPQGLFVWPLWKRKAA